MLSTQRNIYPDSDFFPDAFQAQSVIALDLSQIKLYRVHGESMIKLADLQALDIAITGIEEDVIEFPKAA